MCCISSTGNSEPGLNDALAQWFSTGGPQLGILLHKWATARKSGGPRTSVYFENGFACQIRLEFFFGDRLHCYAVN